MAFGHKARRRELLFIQGATRNLKEPVAGPALKVVVVVLSGPFIEHAEAGGDDLSEPPRFHQALQVAIHGRLVQRPYREAAGLQDFIDAQGPIHHPEDHLNRRMVNLLGRRSNVLFPQVGVRMAEDFRPISID